MADVNMSDPVRQLLAMDAEVVPAKYIAPVLKMSESVLIHRVKSGLWDQDNLGKYVISGNRVKFFRKDFLIKCGFMEPEPEEPTDHQLMAAIVAGLETLLKTQKMMLQLMDEQNDLIHAMMPGPALRYANKDRR